MLHHVVLARTDVSEEHSASIIRMTRICELGTTLAVTSNQSMLQRNAITMNTLLFIYSMFRLLVTANVVPSFPILVTQMMEVIHSSKMLVLIRATWRNIPEDGIHNKRTVWKI
jgi:hypothetical protein